MYSQDGIMSLAKAGRNGDTELAHLMVGEVVLPPGILTGNKRLKNAIEKSLAKTDTSLSDVTVGGDTVSINPYTGLPEFGFLSKLWKKVKKVVDPVAQVARFIPGPWQAAANIYVKGKAAINIAKGDDSTSDYLSIFTGPKLFGDEGSLSKFKEFGFDFAGKGGSGDYSFDTLRKGVGSLFGGGTQDTTQEYIVQSGDNLENIAAANNTTVDAILELNPQYKANPGLINPNEVIKLPSSSGNFFQRAGDFIGGLDGTPGFQLSDLTAGLGALRSGIQGATGIDPALLALAKYYGDATEKALEKQIGGMGDVRDSIRPDLKYDTYGLGGFDLGYAQGGAVLDMRDGGESIGPGTGTSDDIPAMLSDGEFVMTAKANKGAGSVGLKQGKGGIMELSPNMEPDRQRGAKNMMTLMRYFEGLA